MRLCEYVKNKNLIYPLIYCLLAVIELIAVNLISDLRPWLSTWAPKSHEILRFTPPSDNYYGPGAALLLIPFLWNTPDYFAANIFYTLIGALAYYFLCQRIKNSKLKFLALSSLLLNPYLFWLCHSSQDTVYELALLMVSLNLFLKNRFVLFTLVTFILAETRSQYWLFLFLVLVSRIIMDLRKKQKLKISYSLPLVLLIITSSFNLINYGSPSITWYAGETFELGNSKFMYLAHPKFDADHLLGLADSQGTYREGRAPTTFTPAEKNAFYFNQGIQSIKENPKQYILNVMQKIDSYVFSSQKIPSSPGYFILDSKANSIKILDERLSWSLILGNLVYQIWRALVFIVFVSALTVLIVSFRSTKKILIFKEQILLLPWVTSFIVILLFYMETRYKIIPELLLPLYSFIIFDKFRTLESDRLKLANE